MKVRVPVAAARLGRRAAALYGVIKTERKELGLMLGAEKCSVSRNRTGSSRTEATQQSKPKG